MMLLRLAMGLAVNRDRQNRWRLVVLPVAAFCFMVLIHVGTAVTLMIDRQEARSDARALNLSSAAADSDVFVQTDLDIWHGQRINLAWVDPAGDGPPARPPGMAGFPAPGTAVVSPALAELIAQNPELERRYPAHQTLSSTGLRTGGELVAYVRPASDRHIGGEDQAARLVDGEIRGEGPVVRVADFEAPDAVGAPILKVFPSDSLPVPQFVAVLAVVLLMPACLILALGAAAGSRSRDRRLTVLSAIGVSRSQLVRIGTLETVLLALPGLVAAGLLWHGFAGRLSRVPFVDYRLIRGDVDVPVLLLVATTVLGVVLSAICGIALNARRMGRGQRAAAPERTRVRRWGLVPFAVTGLVCVVVSLVGDSSGNLRLLGLVGAIIGTPLIVPTVLRAVGSSLAERRHVAVELVGRVLDWNPRLSSRPFSALAAMIVVVLSVSGAYAFLSTPSEQSGADESGLHGVSLEWRESQPGDLSQLTGALEGKLVAPYQFGSPGQVLTEEQAEAASDSGEGVPVQLGLDCAQVSDLLKYPACQDSDAATLQPAAEHDLGPVLIRALGTHVEAVSLAPGLQVNGEEANVVVLGVGTIEDLDRQVRTIAFSALPAPFVTSAIFNHWPPPQVLNGWIVAGGTIAFLALSFAVLLSLVDQTLGNRSSRQHLVNMGVDRRWLLQYESLSFAVPYLAVAVVSFVIGCVICFWMVSIGGSTMPWGIVATVAAGLVLFGGLGTGATAGFGTRDVLRVRD